MQVIDAAFFSCFTHFLVLGRIPGVSPKRRKRAARLKTRTTRRKAVLPNLALRSGTRRQISGIAQICLGVVLLLVLYGEAGLLGESVGRVLRFFFGSYGAAF